MDGKGTERVPPRRIGEGVRRCNGPDTDFRGSITRINAETHQNCMS